MTMSTNLRISHKILHLGIADSVKTKN